MPPPVEETLTTILPSVESIPVETTSERSENNEEFSYIVDDLTSLFSSLSLSDDCIMDSLISLFGSLSLSLSNKVPLIEDNTANESIIEIIEGIEMKNAAPSDNTPPSETIPPSENTPPSETSPPSSISTFKEVKQEAIKNEEIDPTIVKENDSAAVQQERDCIERESVATTKQHYKDRNRAEIESIYKSIQDDIAISRDMLTSARVNQSRATNNIKSFDQPVFKKYTNEAVKNEGLGKKSSPSPSLQLTSPFSSSSSPSSSRHYHHYHHLYQYQ